MGDWNRLDSEMRAWCNTRNLGYDQSNRWDIRVGGECDCSSLVYWVLWDAGYLTKPGNPWDYTLYTGTLYNDLVNAGWRAVRANGGKPDSPCVVLNEGNHVGIWLGDVFAQASIDENGRATGGKAGDQTDRETNTRSWYVYSRGWDWYIYPPEDGGNAGIPNNEYVRRLQHELNVQCGATLDEDNEFGALTKAAASKSNAILRNGDAGNMTRILQEVLNAHGFNLDVDGEFGAQTDKAVRDYQRMFGLEVDGEVGGETWQHLLR